MEMRIPSGAGMTLYSNNIIHWDMVLKNSVEYIQIGELVVAHLTLCVMMHQ